MVFTACTFSSFLFSFGRSVKSGQKKCTSHVEPLFVASRQECISGTLQYSLPAAVEGCCCHHCSLTEVGNWESGGHLRTAQGTQSCPGYKEIEGVTCACFEPPAYNLAKSVCLMLTPSAGSHRHTHTYTNTQLNTQQHRAQV